MKSYARNIEGNKRYRKDVFIFGYLYCMNVHSNMKMSCMDIDAVHTGRYNVICCVQHQLAFSLAVTLLLTLFAVDLMHTVT